MNHKLCTICCAAAIGLFSGTRLLAESADVVLHPKAERLPFSLMGPIARLDDKTVLAIDDAHVMLSENSGKTWSSRDLFSKEQKDRFNIKVSDERAILRARSGTIVAAFMDMNSKKWTWKDSLRDAPGAVCPNYVMRSLDNG